MHENMTLEDAIADLESINEDLLDSVDFVKSRYGDGVVIPGNLKLARNLIEIAIKELRLKK